MNRMPGRSPRTPVFVALEIALPSLTWPGYPLLMPNHAAAQSRDLEKIAELNAFEQRLLSRTGPTRIVPSRPDEPDPPPADDETREATPAAAGPNIAEVTDDLLCGMHDPGAAVVALARQAAQSMHWLWNWTDTMGKTLSAASEAGGGESTFAMMERLARLRADETKTLGRLMLTLQMLRDHELQIEAQVVRGTQRGARGRGHR